MAILILGNGRDEHAAHMLRYLQTHGADAEFLDGGQFPAEIAISFDPAARTGSIRLPGGRTLAISEISSVYWRCYNPVPCPDLPDAGQAYIAQNDARSLFESVLIGLPARWVNGWRAYQLHQTKPVQLAMVAALGVRVPETLLSNNPEAVAQFAARHPRAVFKPVQGGAHTRPITPRHLTAENLANLSVATVTLQEEIQGTNIRVFVAGQRVMACEIITGELDYREDADPRIEAVQLPPEIEARSREIARTLDLLWTGIDFRRTPEGRYVFLEANPSPMFLGFEHRTGLPLTEALAALLITPCTS
jgi:hypothetical protein